jgi:integrase
MRHTAATRLDATKASPAVTAAILGHGPATVTGNYIHVGMREKLDALLASERLMFGDGLASLAADEH